MLTAPPPASSPNPQALLRKSLFLAGALVVLWGVMYVMPSPTEERSATSLLRAAEETPLPPARSAADALFRSVDSLTQAASATAPDPAALDGIMEAPESLPEEEIISAEETFSLTTFERPSQDTPDAGTVAYARETTRRNSFGTFFLFMGALGLLGSLFWMMRLKKNQQHSTDSSQSLHELGTLALTQQQSIHLVAVGPEVLLIGQGPQGLQVLSRYPRDTAPLKSLPAPSPTPVAEAQHPQAVPSRTRPADGSPGDFAAQLRRRAPHLFVTPRA